MQDRIAWDESIRVGVAEFDEAHRTLIGIANELIAASEANQQDGVVGAVLEGLIEYTESHFQREEALMEQTRYPELEEHRRQHRLLMNQVYLFKSQFIAGEVDANAMVRFLRDWILTHIQDHDRRYSPHLHAHGIS